MKESRATSHMGGKKSGKAKSGKKPHSIHVRRAHSGGFVATHHHKMADDGSMPEDEEHVIPDMQALQQHMQDNMGDQGAAPQGPPPDAAGAAGPPQVPGM